MLKVAVIGMGWWGKTLVTAMKKSPKFEVRKGVKRHPESEAEFARAQGFEIISDYGAVLADPAVDAVVLCTPHTMQLEAIVESSRTGRKVAVKS